MRNTDPSLSSPSVAASTARHLAPVLALCGAFGLLLAGCSTEPDSHVVSAPPPPTRAVASTTTITTVPMAVANPTVVVANPAYVTTSAAVPVVVANPAYVTTSAAVPVVSTTVVTQAPPAPQQEVVLAQPTSQHVWLAGYWTWRNERYEWMAGHWELPPSSNSAWVSPRWEQQGNAYRFYEGYWN